MTVYKQTMSEALASMYEAKMSSSQINRLKKAYEPMRDKKLSMSNANKLSAMMDKVSKDKEALIQLFKADIPFVSQSAVTKLISKHGMKGAEINKLREEVELDEKKTITLFKNKQPTAYDRMRRRMNPKDRKTVDASDKKQIKDLESRGWYRSPYDEEVDLGEANEWGELTEKAEYDGRPVDLNNPTEGDTKKYKVYVRNDKGNVVKVEFGDPNMEIKRDSPGRLKAFRARHQCDTNPGPKWKARYWSCKFWEKGKTVTDLMKG